MEKAEQLSWLYDLYRMGRSEQLRENPAAVQQRILQHIVTGFDADTGSLALCKDKDSLELNIVAAIGLPDGIIGGIITKGEGVMGWVAEKGEPVLLNGDISGDTRFHNVQPRTGVPHPASAMCWPLTIEQRVIGTLSINRKGSERAYTENDLEHGGVLVSLITIVIENAQLHSEQQQRIRMFAHLHEKNREANRKLEETHHEALQARERLDSILGSLDNVVWSITPDTYETIYLNPAAEKLYGHPVADFIADSNLWFATVHPDDRERVGACMPEIMQKGVLDIEYRIVRPNKEIRWIHDHVHAIFDEHGKAVSLNGLGTDITLSRQAEVQLKNSHDELQAAYSKLQQAQSQLLQSEKMASIGQLAAGVAHEINNPIGYVYSNLGSLQKYLDELFNVVEAYEKVEPLLAPHQEAMAGIRAMKEKADLGFLKEDVAALMSESREGITRVKKIVQNLKDFSHAGSDEEWEWVDLHQGLDSTLNIVWNEIKYKADVNKEYGKIPEVECLSSQLNQVFMNLMVNAAHAIEERGTITIRTGTEGDQVWIEVSDTGKGIAPEHLSKIFDPFFTTKPVGKGTGLGLSVSYSIIQTHHGNIKVTSEVGKGTTFRITVPVKQPAKQAEEQFS
jgi:PAS domain S-box-containing protein